MAIPVASRAVGREDGIFNHRFGVLGLLVGEALVDRCRTWGGVDVLLERNQSFPLPESSTIPGIKQEHENGKVHGTQ